VPNEKIPYLCGLFFADKKSTTESTTGIRPQTRQYINRETMAGEAQYYFLASFVNRFVKRNRMKITREARLLISGDGLGGAPTSCSQGNLL
jgi:hypothetical protein